MYKGKRVCVVVPAYNEEERIRDVLTRMVDLVDNIVVVDDGSSDSTGDVAAGVKDPRAEIVRHDRNQGVGAAVVTGHRRALDLGADISVVMAGDGQMDPRYLSTLLDPIVDGGFDFTKGNRFYNRGTLREMPANRVRGNALLSILTKFATGYWDIFDPQNGYTAISREALLAIPLDRLKKDYLFENSLLWELGFQGFRVKDVPIPAVYRGQRSGIRTLRFTVAALRFLLGGFWRRMIVKYVVRDFHPVALFYLSGFALLLGGLAFGALVVYWSLGDATASTATVMLAVVPFFLGFQLLLTAITVDISLSRR